jgi:hypothetical protein
VGIRAGHGAHSWKVVGVSGTVRSTVRPSGKPVGSGDRGDGFNVHADVDAAGVGQPVLEPSGVDFALLGGFLQQVQGLTLEVLVGVRVLGDSLVNLIVGIAVVRFWSV